MRTQLTNIKDRECAQMYQKKNISRVNEHFDKDGVVF